MPEVVTTFTSVEKKAGSNERGGYTLTTFTDVEGKKFKTFDDDVSAKGDRLVGQAVAVDFTVKSRQWDGRTLVDNMIVAIKDGNEMSSSSSTNGASAAPAMASPVSARIFAFKAAVDLLGTAPEMFGDETPNFVGICKVADAIHTWAEASEDAVTADPEPEPEPVSN